MNIQRLKNTIEELKLLGIEGTFYRILYEAKNRTGFKRRLEPVEKNAAEKWQRHLISDVNIDAACLNEWIRQASPFLIYKSTDYTYYLSNIKGVKPDQIIENAGEAAVGNIKTFSKQFRSYGNPKQWHLNPVRNKCWTDVHYSQVMKGERDCGDIKLVWEPNRFSFVFDYVRAYYLTGDSYWCRAFCADLKNWQQNNIYRQGPNWNSGQELAIRVLAWFFGLDAFYADKSFSEADFQRIVSLMYLHGEHLEANIDYAQKAVHNNHLIGEALGLYVIGLYFPWFKQSARWKKRGRELLENDCLKQFYPDGGYCQNSHNYHRLALHYYLWAWRVAELNGEPLDSKIKQLFEQSLALLLANLNMSNGMLPNYGANDGALLNPWTCCDYTDYRPLLNALNYAVNKTRLFEPGRWDEELLWFFGPEALDSPVSKPVLKSSSFPVAGLHILRQDPENFVVFRCGSIIDRFGQADQLHVDLWWRGLNIAQDAGSYLYNDELQFHRHFVGTAAHNTVTVDDQNQMLLYRRFKFLYWTKAKLLDFAGQGNRQEVAGEHYGYDRLKESIIHRRKVISLSADVSIIIDQVYGKEKLQFDHKMQLHWLLLNCEYEKLNIERWQGVKLATAKGDFCILTLALDDTDNRVIPAEMQLVKGRAGQPEGWVSRYYSCKEEALSLNLTVKNKETKFISVFVPAGEVEEVLRKEVLSFLF